MPVSYHFSQLKFRSGDQVDLSPDETVIVVGPNNAGKTSTLRAIVGRLSNEVSLVAPIVDVVTAKEGTVEEFEAWVRTHAAVGRQERGQDVLYSADFGQLHINTVRSSWQWEGNATRLFADFSEPCERLSGVNSVGTPPVDSRQAENPIQSLWYEEALEERVREWFRRAFNTGICQNRVGGNTGLFLGDPPALQEGEKLWTMAYVQRLARQSARIENQGHGMRAFLALLLRVLLSKRFVDLVDEPEAFLHPPQARTLAQMLVTEKPSGKQLFFATHSADILRGACDAKGKDVSILRLTRDGDTTRVHRLSAAQLRAVWQDPLLDYSNVLDGLFHDLVVVCEADGDCRFFQALLRAVAKDGARPDVLFTWCAGKSRVAKVVSALRQLGVKAHAAVDFDALNDKGVLKGLVEAVGGTPDPLLQRRERIAKSLAGKTPPLSKKQAEEQIGALLAKVNGDEVDDKTTDAIKAVLKRTSPWAEAKAHGIEAFRADAHVEAATLLGELARIGVFVVPVGELECFAKSVGGHGPQRITKLLETKTDLAGDPELTSARRYLKALLGLAAPETLCEQSEAIFKPASTDSATAKRAHGTSTRSDETYAIKDE